MLPTTHHPNRYLTVLIVIICLIGILVVFSDWQSMRQVLAQANWRYLPVILLFTVLSYTCYSYAYAFVCQMLGITMGKRELADACFISTVVNHVLTTAGLAGYSLRYLLMRMYNISFKDVVASSFMHYYLTSLDMLTFLPFTFIYLIIHADVPRGISIVLGSMTVIFSLMLLLITILVIFPSLRQPFIKLLGRLGKLILHRDYLPWLSQLDESFTRGSQAIIRRPFLLGLIMILTLADFASSITAMGFVFMALGTAVKPAALVSGYVIGIMSGVISMVPGGFGIQEGSMAGVYALLGVRLEQAVLAAILFRILYYLVPYFLIFPFYKRLLGRARQQASTGSQGA